MENSNLPHKQFFNIHKDTVLIKDLLNSSAPPPPIPSLLIIQIESCHTPQQQVLWKVLSFRAYFLGCSEMRSLLHNASISMWNCSRGQQKDDRWHEESHRWKKRKNSKDKKLVRNIAIFGIFKHVFGRAKYGQVGCPWNDLAKCSSDALVFGQ